MMTSTFTKRLRVAVPALTALAATVPTVAGLAAAPAEAATSANLAFHCTFPLIGSQPMALKIGTSLPTSIAVGQTTGPIQIDATASMGADTTKGLAAVGTSKLGGSADAKARIDMPGGNGLDLSVPVALASTPVPTSGGFDVKATATINPISFAQAGTAKVTLKGMVLTITPRVADGRPTGLDTFDSDCTLDDGQDGVIATIAVGGGPTPPPPPPPSLTYGITGSSLLKGPQAQVPLQGTAKVDLTGTAVSAALALQPTRTSFALFGFLPVAADVVLTPTGPTTGQIGSGGVTTETKVDVTLPSITAFGFPVGGGPDCHTTTPATVPLGATTFDPARGGVLRGTYTLPTFTSGCGIATYAVNAAVSGPGNTIAVTLTRS